MHLATCHLVAHSSSIAHWLHTIWLILLLLGLPIRAWCAAIVWVSHSWWSSSHVLRHSLSHVLAIAAGLLLRHSTRISITRLTIATILSLHAARIATVWCTAHWIVWRLLAHSSKVLTTCAWWTSWGGSCSLIPISLRCIIHFDWPSMYKLTLHFPESIF